MTQRAALPILTSNGQMYCNTSLGRSASINSSLSSFRPVLVSSSCSNFVFPSYLPLKRIKPEPWQRLFEGKKQQELSIRKNQSNTDVPINEDLLNVLHERSIFDENSQRSFVPTPIQAHIDQLYEQIDDLTLQLSDERFRHKQTRIKAEEQFSSQLKDQERQFQERRQQILADHQTQLNEQAKKYFNVFNEEQMEGFQREEQLKNELDFLKKSFHTYKINLDKERIQQSQVQTNEISTATKEEEINRKINDTLMKERKLINERQKIENENRRKQQEDEIAAMQKVLAETTVDQEHLELLNKELTLTKLELIETKELTKNLSIRLNDLESQHIQTIRELNDYRVRFDEQTKEIEKLYAARVDQLY